MLLLKQNWLKPIGIILISALTMFQCNDDDGGAALEADFTSDVTSIPAGQAVTFTDQTIGVPDLRTWTFEEGTPPSFNGSEVTVTYSTPGEYDVTLTVLNAANTSTETKEDYITVTLVADFLADKTEITAGETVFFSDQTNGTATGWSWSLPGGDPESSDQQDVAVTYQNPGTYDVTLEVVDSKGNNSTETKTGYIVVE